MRMDKKVKSNQYGFRLLSGLYAANLAAIS